MKSSFRTLAVAFTLIPAAAFAQTSNEPPTHEQVMNQLTQLRQDGYRPSTIHYPADIQSAQARRAAQDGNGAAGAPNSGFGGGADGTMQSGGGMTSNAMPSRSMFKHH
ncbi:DUF4148 domain-containing protein [Trinickia diaoshuihuensis]|uniref:DUF4148 domain-containing protein n=1 Tax=Trinickia diaoshuihuensis TaxID=2292265 RepID=UPI000E22CF82|nr:DUF4148 domain-containing protein [Trinickia diaoshuihuensis]